MKVYLLRHGSRNHSLGDVPLNEEGMLEARELASHSHWPADLKLLSSPKKRALMTLQPLANKRQQEILPFTELDQMRSQEGEGEFKARVKNFLYRIEQQEFGNNLVVCSHSDWLSTAVGLVPTDATDLPFKMFHCAEFICFEIIDGLWEVR